MHAPSQKLLQYLRIAIQSTHRGQANTVRNASSYVSTSTRLRCQNHILNKSMTGRSLPTLHQFDRNSTFSTTSSFLSPPANNAASSRTRQRNPYAPTHSDRGPKSKEDTQTDFGVMDVLGNTPIPATSIDACTLDGFHLDNGIKTDGGKALIVVGGEAFLWTPWASSLVQDGKDTRRGDISDLLDVRRGILTFPDESFALLDLLHPKPDLLIIGTGAKSWMLSASTKKYITEVLGCRVDVMDTRNATSGYNLLAKERGVEGGAGVGGLFLPLGWDGRSK